MFHAGQRREQAEIRDRMRTEFVVSRDAAVAGNIASGISKPKRGGFQLPVYLRDDDKPASNGLTGQELWDAMDAFASRIEHPGLN